LFKKKSLSIGPFRISCYCNYTTSNSVWIASGSLSYINYQTKNGITVIIFSLLF
jgi:hypothetical protein